MQNVSDRRALAPLKAGTVVVTPVGEAGTLATDGRFVEVRRTVQFAVFRIVPTEASRGQENGTARQVTNLSAPGRTPALAIAAVVLAALLLLRLGAADVCSGTAW